jgi:hypothetical protein|tara:strand:+ start:210 stop:320 length:111 start_codon:yes stop_codon:yes gene_type:complete
MLRQRSPDKVIIQTQEIPVTALRLVVAVRRIRATSL